MMERQDSCVCIVGAGPAGLVVAHRLLQAQVPCVVLERLSSEALCARARAGMIEDRTVQALGPYGLAAPILEQGTTNGLVEFRVDGAAHIFDYAAWTGGRGHFVYPQHLLVRAWADRHVARGGRIDFSTEVSSIEIVGKQGELASRAVVQARAAGGEHFELRCQAVVLAAGAGTSLVPSGIQSHDHTYPFRWLTAMLEMAPLAPRTIYAPHSTGFAAHLRRSPELTRYYLQIPASDALGAWQDDRIRPALELRLGLDAGSLSSAPIVERDVLDLRVRVREPLQQGPVYLAGDAAHLVTPAGGKGMNLAIQDGLELAEGLIDQFSRGAPERLAAYSRTRLPLIWQTQEFSNSMLTLHCGGTLNVNRGAPDPEARFAQRLHRAQVERLFTDPPFARWFAHRYAGVDETAPA